MRKIIFFLCFSGHVLAMDKDTLLAQAFDLSIEFDIGTFWSVEAKNAATRTALEFDTELFNEIQRASEENKDYLRYEMMVPYELSGERYFLYHSFCCNNGDWQGMIKIYPFERIIIHEDPRNCTSQDSLTWEQRVGGFSVHVHETKGSTKATALEKEFSHFVSYYTSYKTTDIFIN